MYLSIAFLSQQRVNVLKQVNNIDQLQLQKTL